jgi:predicted oxidoreductase
MRTIKFGQTDWQVPSVAVGCMRINRLNSSEAQKFIKTALDGGANFFDHADIYGRGACEEIFAAAVSELGVARAKLILQSKCGIVPGQRFDFSKEHILASVDGSLRRLRTDYLDVLLLHRPDALVEPEEVAAAFDQLTVSGKVRHFGVSNQNPGQMRLLQKFVKQPLQANQLQLSITNATMISAGTHVNMLVDAAVDRDGGILDFCRLHDITVQPWSPFQHGFFKGVFLDNAEFPALNQKLNELAEKYNVTNTTITLAWLLRHPANLQPVTGTMNPARLRDCIKAADLRLTRPEWYEIYLAAGHTLP